MGDVNNMITSWGYSSMIFTLDFTSSLVKIIAELTDPSQIVFHGNLYIM